MKARAKELELEKVRVNASGCLDRCELGPTMVIYPEGVWYRYETRADVDEILEVHLLGKGRVDRLLLRRVGYAGRRELIPKRKAGKRIGDGNHIRGRHRRGSGGRRHRSRVRPGGGIRSGKDDGEAQTAGSGRLPAADRKCAPGKSSTTVSFFGFRVRQALRAKTWLNFMFMAAWPSWRACSGPWRRSGGLRPSEAGEFTRRAFENGKLDLTAAEGLADLVDAETEVQRRQALRQVQGELGAVYDTWRARLLKAIGHLEATIDFADEDLPETLEQGVFADIVSLRQAIAEHLADGGRGERIRSGIRIAIIGPPNAGKSTLLNVLAKREAAIVSSCPGTTRDVIEVAMDVRGFPVILADTAGLRDAAGEVEEEGVRRARSEARTADLKLAVFDGALWPAADEETKKVMDGDTIAVVNKSDLAKGTWDTDVCGMRAMAVSARTGDGFAQLLSAVESAVRERFSHANVPALTRVRHRAALEESYEALGRCRRGLEPELVAEDLRLAARALGRITGRVDVEDVLDVIFRDFCIGK